MHESVADLIAQSLAWLGHTKFVKGQLLAGNPPALSALEALREAHCPTSLQALQSDPEKLAYWINVYNGFTNYWLARNCIRESVWEVPDFFKQTAAWGGVSLSLDDIEHGLLRKQGRPPFPTGDPRLALQVHQLDYRLHFALNCGSSSCPAIFGYQLDTLEEQLQDAEALFSKEHFKVDHDQKRITCLDTFDYYREDFGPRFLNVYPDYKVTLIPFNWALD